MKTHTDNFKTNIKQLGRKSDSKIIYTLNNENVELDGNDINSISLHYQSSILKSVMKQLDIDSNVNIPVGTEINFKFGIKIDVEQEADRIIKKATSNFYENFYHSHASQETLTRLISTGLHVDVNSLLNAYVYNGLTEQETNFISGVCKTNLSKGNLYPYQPLGVKDYTVNSTIVLKDEVAASPDSYSFYEYLDYGNYIVYSSEKQEESKSYKIVCYDKMLYSMKDYETPKINNTAITYPITIRDYINAIATHLGLTFKNINDTFANYNRQIQQELYLDSNNNSLGYTFRDVLDELSQATASTICIDEANDELEIRYINETSDIIDEEYLKDTDVNFGEKYGPINSIVLSRAGGSDNVYLQDAESIAENGLCELKISDNQIMNFNDRSDYLPDILNKLDGLEYYTNEYQSTGVCYYEPCDRYTVKIGDNYYSCVMFNDEINIEQGLEEYIYTELPDESETDYTKADSTDRRINQTYLIVDKQNQTIEAVVSETTDPNNPDSMVNKVTRLNARVGALESEISEIADMTTSGETSYASLSLTNINTSEPVTIKIHPTSINIGYDYPCNDYPQNDYCGSRILMFTRTYEEDNVTKTEYIPYELPNDLLYYDATHYDEFLLDYSSQTCQVTKKCKYNSDGSVGLLDTELIVPYEYPTINLGNGDYVISLYGYNYGYIFARLMVQNIYTDQFYTRYETDSLIQQKADEINLNVSETLTNYYDKQETNEQITLSAGQITSNVSRTYSTKTETEIAKGQAISASDANTDTKLQNYSTTTQITNTIDQKIVDNNTAYVDIEVAKKVDNEDFNGANIMLEINNDQSSATISADKINLQGYVTVSDLSGSGTTEINGDNISTGIIKSSNYNASQRTGMALNLTNGKLECNDGLVIYSNSPSSYDLTLNQNTGIETPRLQVINVLDGDTGTDIYQNYVKTYYYQNFSLEKLKKNIIKFENALNEIKNIDIYEYNLKSEDNQHKKHIGCVIGDKYNYSKKITSQENDSIDLYSMTSLCLQAIKEQQKQIEDLQNKIHKLERESEK